MLWMLRSVNPCDGELMMSSRAPRILRGLLTLVPVVAMGCSYTVHGIVRDKTTGNPISGAGVTIGEQNATTGATGVYEIRGVEVKRLTTLLVNAPGYHLFNMSVARAPGESRELARDIDLMSKPPGDQAQR